MTARRRVVITGTTDQLSQLADVIEAGMIGRLRSDGHTAIAAACEDLIERLREADNCPPVGVNADRKVAPVELITLTEWVSRVAGGGQVVDPRTARRWASEGRLPVFVHHGKRYVRADQERPHDQRRKRNG